MISQGQIQPNDVLLTSISLWFTATARSSVKMFLSIQLCSIFYLIICFLATALFTYNY